MNYLVQELMAECLWVVHSQKNADIQDVENVIDNILIMQSEMISKISNPDPNDAKKFFKNLRKDFLNQIDEIIEQIKTLA